MAADPSPDWLASLPPSSWSHGVTRDGRVFFINEEAKSTTWLHPVTGEAVITGHRKTPDLPTGWEEGFTFEGARCFINHNERKVTCKHPVSGTPSQDNCIFVVNEQPASKAPPSEKKERPTSTMSEASNYTGGSDYTAQPSSPTARPSRSSKKVHNFGKRSNSIKRNPNAPVVKSNWLYKQDSTGMKMWKKRWFVLSDMCLFYYRDEKEEGILGSILLPSFHISMLSVDDHISKKYAFKATHPNMRTYYFCTDTAKEMESWMKVMTDAALVHTEPIRRLEKAKVDTRSPQEMNNMLNHRVLTRPEIQNNERNRESLRQEEKKQKHLEKQPSIHREKDRSSSLKDSQQKDEKQVLQKDGQKYSLQKEGDRYMLQKDLEKLVLQKDGDRYALQKDGERYTLQKDGDKYLLQKDGQRYTLHKDGEKYTLPNDAEKYPSQKDGEKYQQKDGVRPTQKEKEKPMLRKETEKREGEKYGFQKELGMERPLTKINSIKLQPAQAAAIAAAVSTSRQLQSGGGGGGLQYKAAQVNGSGERGGERSPGDALPQRTSVQPHPTEPERSLSRTDSMQQLEQWVRMHRTRGQDDDTRSITSYQTLPRNMPSHRAQVVPRYPEGYRTLPRNMLRPDSICSVAGSVYDRALQPTTAEKRRSMRDDTMWQLYEWQQRQAHTRLGYGTLPSPKTMSHIPESIPSSPSHGSLALYHSVSPNRPYNPSSEVSSPVFRGDLSIDRRHRAHLAKYTYLPDRRVSAAPNITPQSLQGKTPEELTLLLIKLRRQQAELNSIREHTLAQLMQLNIDAANPKNEILSHHLQRNLMYLDSQMKENEPIIFMIHTMIENSAPRPQLYQQMSPDEYRENTFSSRPEELDVDTKLSRLCEQGKVVRTQEEKLQQLHREKHTLETALLSASQEIEMSADNPASVQSVIQQRDVLQSGLLSTCRELSRVTSELDRSWREYDRLEADVTLAKRNLLEQLEALGSPQTEPPSQQHVQIQKELWRIQDVMEALSKNKPKRSTEPSFPGANPISNLQKSEESNSVPPRPPLPHLYEGGERAGVPPPPCPGPAQPHTPRTTPHRSEDRKAVQRNGSHTGPDYRLYKSEPELTTVAEVDESNGEEKSEQAAEKEPSGSKGVSFPVGVVSPRTKSPMPESSTIASYVTLRKNKKPDPRTDRPRSAVEHMSVVEGARQRMSVEEQMERIRRHQQGALREREKRREENSLSHSLSFSKDNSYYYTLQTCRSSALSPEEQEVRRKETSPGEMEPVRVAASKENPKPAEKDQRDVQSRPEPCPKTSEAKRSPEKDRQKESPADHVKILPNENSLQTAVMVRVGTEEDEEEEEEEEEKLPGQNQAQIIKDAFDVPVSKHSTLVSVNSLSSPPQSPSSAAPSPPQLPDGSHFMCV
ncbi:pleckstrin homology domain-containing family A member 5 isoform X15 [Hoplias malabaricus]|uniref:pleckstrin homology domain-containing family A member 5 isoform X15 n=1 Tax=Hoplias malabaricus TaxID=27720 RepID=UPI003461E2FF